MVSKNSNCARQIYKEHVMKFEGLLIKESLKDESVLDHVQVTKVETWDASDRPVWTAVYFDGDASHADRVAQRLSHVLLSGWYCNIATANDSYVVFANRVFKYPRGEDQGRAEAQEYGRSLGLPEEQLDWGESYPLA
jgi:hypothetical protein